VRSELTAITLSAILLAACGGADRFPMREPMSNDDDKQPFAPMPQEYYSPFAWDGANQTIFYPVSRFWAVDPGGEATNVNALGEVPDSSWFINRLGTTTMDLETLANAACGDEPPLDARGPWTAVSAKANGANPGFVIADPGGRRFVIKFDSPNQPERATAADVIGSVLYWAAGYHAPCNRVLFFDRAMVGIDPDAKAKDELGNEVPLAQHHLDNAWNKGFVLPDGRNRASASQFIEGRPIGPWKYQGTRDDDLNDVVPHEDRRELRGAYVLASWINHFDSREQNTLSAWIDEDGTNGHVRHYYIDFGDCFGSMWAFDGISRRLGHSNYLDVGDVVGDFLTLGLLDRPWHQARLGATGNVLGYYGVERFEPDAWEPGYPNPAFSRATERDAAWMARIIARFDEPMVRRVVDRARLDDRFVHGEIVRLLLERQRLILTRWFRRISPLASPRIVDAPEGAALCLEDLAVTAGVMSPRARLYRAQAWVGERREHRPLQFVPAADTRHACVALPDMDGVSSDRPGYMIVDVAGLGGSDDDQSGPARVHVYQRGAGLYTVVGLERP